MDDPDNNIIRDLMKHQRKYASDFEWFRNEKGVKETGIVRTLLESLSRTSACEYRNLRHCKVDPPDCLADTLDGSLIGFEVRELVDQETIELNERGNEVYREWTDSEVIGKLSTILEEKDRKNYVGGPYRKLILVVHTAEPDLEYQHLATFLRSHLFGQTKQLTEAYLLFPYDSPNKAYPYIQLKLAGSVL